VIHSFWNANDGWQPAAGVTFDRAGNLYGTTIWGGSNGIYNGVVFRMTPNADGTWAESVIHAFGGNDGSESWASVAADRSGNIYGTTQYGGAYGNGVFFRLSAKNGWQETWHSFDQNEAYPTSDVVIDAHGNNYETTQGDGTYSFGSVFQIIP
jgi:uncharacterized repeat protein (TIGR03803 family)